MSRRTHVMQIIPGLAIGPIHGGAELYAARLAASLSPAQFECSVCCLWDHGTDIERSWAKRLIDRGVAVVFGPPYSEHFRSAIGAGLRHAARVVRTQRPDIIQTHTEPADMIGLLLRAARLAPRALRTCHNSVEWPFDLRIAALMDLLCPWVFDMETAISPDAAQRLNSRRMAKLRSRSAEVILTGIDQEQTLSLLSQRDLRAQFGIPADAPLVVSVGRLTEQKGFDILIRAIPILHRTFPELRVVIVGEGQQRQELAALAGRLGVSGYVSLLGARADVPDVMRVADVMAFPSRWEGLPAVVIEAMLVGRPIVASHIPGMTQLISHRLSGWLCPAENPDALAAQIGEALLAPPELRAAIVARAQAQAQPYTIEHVARAYTRCYEKIEGRLHR